MDKRYNIDIADDIVSVRFSQKPDVDAFRNALNDVHQIKPKPLRLWDFTCGMDISFDDIQIIADYAKSLHLETGKIAVVAPEDLTYGLIRVFHAFRGEADRIQYEVFRSEQEAREWLKSESLD